MERVWTKLLLFEGDIKETDGAWHTFLGADTWVTQEDIVIVGWDLRQEFCGFVEVDGHCMAYSWLSQSGLINAIDGQIACVQAFEEWDAMLAAQENRIYMTQQDINMLPSGHGIPITEGGTVYLHVHKINSPDENHYCGISVQGLLYYTRGKVRASK